MHKVYDGTGPTTWSRTHSFTDAARSGGWKIIGPMEKEKRKKKDHDTASHSRDSFVFTFATL